MDYPQIYIGTPNEIILCADEGYGQNLSGRFYHAYSRRQNLFKNTDQLIFGMEDFFDSIQFPYPGNRMRSFEGFRNNVIHDRRGWRKGNLHLERSLVKREKIMDDQELLKNHGDKGSFIVRVQQRQNSSMQGRLTWIEQNKTVYFRSAWEMIRLIDSAIGMDSPEQQDDIPNWEE